MKASSSKHNADQVYLHVKYFIYLYMVNGSLSTTCLILWLSFIYFAKFGVNRPKQTKVIKRKLNFYLSNSDLDLDYIHQWSNPKLRLDVSYPYIKFSVNRPKQTKVIERKLNFFF